MQITTRHKKLLKDHVMVKHKEHKEEKSEKQTKKEEMKKEDATSQHVAMVRKSVEGQVSQQGEEKEEKEEERREKCKLCGETFLSKRELLTHLKNHKRKKLLEDNNEKEDQRELKRPKTEQSPGPIICPNCGSSFNNKKLVTRHQRYILNGQFGFFC